MIEKLKELYKKLELMRLYGHAMGVVGFDFETSVPKKAMQNESETMAFLSNEAFKISKSKAFEKLVIDLYKEKDSLDYLDQVLIRDLYEAYLKNKNITPKMDLKFSKVYNQAYIDWLTAKRENNYKKYVPSLKKVIETSKKKILLRDNHFDDIYDNMLDDHEKGLLQEDLDKFFLELKEGLIDLLNRIKKSKKKIRTDFLRRKAPIHKQEIFSKYLLELNGFDFDRGFLSTTEHPFTLPLAKDDARVTTHYYEDMVMSNIYSVIHEGGHAILMQNEPEEDYTHYINDSVSNGKHESVSRFFENIIGRSKAYVHLIYPKFQEIFDEFKDVSEQEFYEGINVVSPSLIRTEADEVTYGLHIVIRYEMEKMLANGTIDVKNANKKWNELYKEYLGVKPKNDSEGILQDVHWANGFGYFPSYALGNAYNAMYLKELKKEYNFDELVSKGDFKTIINWLKEHVFKEANHLDSKEWIKKITNRDLTAKDFVEYLNDKYKDIYDL